MFKPISSRSRPLISVDSNKRKNVGDNKNHFFKPLANVIQKKCEHCEGEEKLQMKGEGNASGGMAAPPIVHDVINSSGQPLDARTRNFFELRFGHDFSNVKIHNDYEAAKSAQSINALAYTTGNNIVFNQNQFSPESDGGRKLLAHELTHVLQQRNSQPISSVQRQPKECENIQDPLTFIFEQLDREFTSPDDVRLIIRAKCLKEAFKLLTPEKNVLFAIAYMHGDKRKDKWRINFEKLATPTRESIAEIIVRNLKKQDTDTYAARITATDLEIIQKPDVIITPGSDSNSIYVTLSGNDYLTAIGAASLLGNFECDKYKFGITQFEIDELNTATYYNPQSKTGIMVDYGKSLQSKLPCYDVEAVGDFWTVSKKIECSSIEPEVDNIKHTDRPKNPYPLSANGMNLSRIKSSQSFIVQFSVILPNGMVHHLKWFGWNFDYCETFEPGVPIDISRARSVPIKTTIVNDGDYPGVADLIGKAAPTTCNIIGRNASPEITDTDSPGFRKCS